MDFPYVVTSFFGRKKHFFPVKVHHFCEEKERKKRKEN
jgi:hypothetical protein